MRKRNEMASLESEDRDWSGFYRLGGVLTVLTGIQGLVASRMASVLYASGYPSNPEAYLQLVSQQQLRANILWSLWIAGDLLGFVPTIAVYLALRRDNRTLALIGALFVGFYLFYDISVTELNSLTLVSLARGYTTAASDALKSPYIAAATYGYAALALQTVLSFGVGAIGWLFWSVVMLSSRVFSTWMGILGIIVNVIGIVGSAAPVAPASFVLGLCQFLAIPLTSVWVIVIGFRLYRHGRRLQIDASKAFSESR
jgi:hypothetical protein